MVSTPHDAAVVLTREDHVVEVMGKMNACLARRHPFGVMAEADWMA